MPWSPKDAKKFKKDLIPGQEHHWAQTANQVLSQTGKEGDAIRAANATTQGAVERRLRKKNQQSRQQGY